MHHSNCACTTPTRRGFLRSAVAGSALLPGIVSQLLAEESDTSDPLAPREPHFAARAKRVIFLFMSGGVSHVDTFDHRPALYRDHGKEAAYEVCGHDQDGGGRRADGPRRVTRSPARYLSSQTFQRRTRSVFSFRPWSFFEAARKPKRSP